MIDLNVNDIVLLESKKYAIQHTLLSPSIGTHIDAVPSTKPRGQTAPFAPVFGDVQDGVKHL